MNRIAALSAAMDRALAIARFGPADNVNPQVGCVIVDADGAIIAEGWHMGAGSDHAEVAALRRVPARFWGSDRRLLPRSGLTAVVTLEPCNHTGRTGPCAEALVQSGIDSVVYGMSEPGVVAGGGARALRAAGVRVVGPLCPFQVQTLLSGWMLRNGLPFLQCEMAESGRPRIVAKWAQSVDGRIAAHDGSSQWITGDDARADVHLRRAQHEGILVGTGTALADNPALTARTPQGALATPPERQPLPVVAGSRPLPPESALFHHPALAARKLTEPVRLLPDAHGHFLPALTALQAEHGISSLFLEGGRTLLTSLLREQLVDELLLYTAPMLLGGSFTALTDIGVTTLHEHIKLELLSHHTFAQDTLSHYRLIYQANTKSTQTNEQ